MGLDDLVDEAETHPVGSVTSKVKGRNIPVDDDAWVQILAHSPYMSTYVLNFSTFQGSPSEESVAKKMIQYLDKVIEGNVRGVKVSEDEKNTARNAREEIIEHHL